MARGAISDTEVSKYQKNGFVIFHQMFNQEGISLLRRVAKEDEELNAHALGRRNGEREKARRSL